MQRALAHAYIHRDAPLPTLRLSLGFMTSTACTTDEVDWPRPPHDRARRRARPKASRTSSRSSAKRTHRSSIGCGCAVRAPVISCRSTRGTSSAHDAAEIRARIAAIATTLEPVGSSTTEAWMLSTRIVQRRALRVAGKDEPPIRKFALQLRVEPVSGVGPSGHTTVTAFSARRRDARRSVLGAGRGHGDRARDLYGNSRMASGSPRTRWSCSRSRAYQRVSTGC